ncbi:hypothetical protein BgiMline_031383, partial [Biomphalaria glabrata]
TLCHAALTTTKFQFQSDLYKTIQPINKNFSTRTSTLCAMKCGQETTCQAYQYDTEKQVCVL